MRGKTSPSLSAEEMGLGHPRAGSGGPVYVFWGKDKPGKATVPLVSPMARVRLQAALRLPHEHWRREVTLHEGGGSCTGNPGCKLAAAGTYHSSDQTTNNSAVR